MRLCASMSAVGSRRSRSQGRGGSVSRKPPGCVRAHAAAAPAAVRLCKALLAAVDTLACSCFEVVVVVVAADGDWLVVSFKPLSNTDSHNLQKVTSSCGPLNHLLIRTWPSQGWASHSMQLPVLSA